MRTVGILCVLALAGMPAAEPAALAIAVREFVLAGHYGFPRGAGPAWIDERSGGAALGLELRGADLARVRGWSGLVISAAITEHGESLVMSAADTEGARDASAAPVALGRLVLPVPQRSFRRLERLAGVIAIEEASGEPVTWTQPLGIFPADHAPVPIPGVPGLALALVERDGDHLAFALDPAAVPRLGSVVFSDARGQVLASHRLSGERTGGRYQLGFRLAVKRVATLAITAYPRLERVILPIALAGLDLGVEVPGRDRIATGVPLGAERF